MAYRRIKLALQNFYQVKIAYKTGCKAHERATHRL